MNAQLHTVASRSRATTGFSLVELLVGIVVAMAAVVVVMQVFKVSEGQRRTTTGGDDAQNSGAIALSQLKRDLRQAGQAVSSLDLMGCTLTVVAGRNMVPLAPLTINPAGIPAGDANTDVLLISYGSGLGTPEGDRINGQPGAATYSVTAPQAFSKTDRVIAAPSTRALACALSLTSVSGDPAGSNITVAAGVAGMANGTLYNLGAAPRFVVYAVRGGRLTICDFLAQDCNSPTAPNWSEVAGGIVSLRAQYARDTSAPRDAVADRFDQVMSPAPAAPASPGCPWSRIVGIRLVLVARSGQFNADSVTPVQPTWAGTVATGTSDALPIAIGGTDWQNYRYKTFETTVPLRNAPSAAATDYTSC